MTRMEAFHSVSNIVPGDGIEVDTTDPHNPIVSATGGGGGGIESISAGLNIQVDDTDPANPVVSFGADSVPGISISEDPALVVIVPDLSTQLTIGLGAIQAQAANLSLGTISSAGTQIVVDTGAGIINLHSDDSEAQVVVDGTQVTISAVNVTISSPSPMVMPSNADVAGTFDAASYVGCMIYDSTLNQMLYSDGTEWVVIGS